MTSRTARFLLLTSLVWSLVLAPFAHAMSMAANMAETQQPVASHCHHADAGPLPLGDCCCHKGKVCHCVAPVALTSQLPLSFSPVPAAYSVTVESFLLHNRPPPEPPPPRLG